MHLQVRVNSDPQIGGDRLITAVFFVFSVKKT